MDHIVSLSPDMVFIELGSNDFCHPRMSPQAVGDQLQSKAHDLFVRGVHFVMVGQMLNREESAIPRATRSHNKI